MSKTQLRLLLISLALTPWLCYLEWGGSNSDFLISVEYQVFVRKFSAEAISHPLVALPLLGQVVILFTVFQTAPSKPIAISGQLMISLLVTIILLSGLLQMNWKIVISTLPFIVCSAIFYLKFRSAK